MHPYLAVARPHLFAHRGASGEAPENTRVAFERAVKLGIAFLEMDCHATADGEIVICHDASLERTTNGEGAICDQAFSALEQLDAGFHFSLDGRTHPFRGRGIRLPRLIDVLRAFPATRVNLEVKSSNPDAAAEVVRIVRGERATERVLLAAEKHEVLESIRRLDPGTALGSSTQDVLDLFQAIRAGTVDRFVPRGHALQIPTQAFGHDLITPEMLGAAKRVELAVHVWTINDPDVMRDLLARGVDGLMSDHPSRLLEVARAG